MIHLEIPSNPPNPSPPSTPAPVALLLPPLRTPIRHVLVMVGYFVALGVGVQLVNLALIALDGRLGELPRATGLSASILDMNRNFDDLLVTFFTLAVALLLVLPVAWVLSISRADDSDPSLPETLVVLAVIVAGVTTLLQDSLARSFGLVGVVAAVRYRNTLKDSKDAVYVFVALGIGMACGLHAHPVAALISFIECGILLTLWIVRGRAQPDDAHLLQRLRVGEKRGDRTPAQALAWLSPEARARLEADLTAQGRYIAMAARLEGRHGKRPNAAITVETSGSAGTRDSIAAQMAQHRGHWRLLSAQEANGVTTLEYLGWVARRKTPPLKFIERLQRADPGVAHVTFRSLRKMVADKVDLAPKPAEPAAPERPEAGANGAEHPAAAGARMPA